MLRKSHFRFFVRHASHDCRNMSLIRVAPVPMGRGNMEVGGGGGGGEWLDLLLALEFR